MTVYMAAQLFFIGNNEKGQCLLPDAGASIAVPTAASIPGKRILHTAVGNQLTLLLTDDNLLFAAGKNEYGQLGRGHSNADNPVPSPVTGFDRERIAQIAAGSGHCAAVTEGGKLFLWGCNAAGQCGTGTAGGNVLTATCCDSGALADADVRVVFVACGGHHTIALTSDGGAIVFGSNYYGELGTGNNDDQPTPERLACAALVGVSIMCCAAGASFTQLVSNDGRVFAMGKNDDGQLGTGNTTDVNTPTEIVAAPFGGAPFGGAPVAAVACGTSHTMAITRGEGKLYSWGRGAIGRTGLGHTDNTTAPHPVVGTLADARVVRIAAGMAHSFALAEDGRVFGFGTAVGIPPAGWNGTPHPIDVEPAVCALGTGCYGTHAAFVTGAPPTEPGDGWLFEKIRQLKSQLAKQVAAYINWNIAFRSRPELREPLLNTFPFAAVNALVRKINGMQILYTMEVDNYGDLNEVAMAVGKKVLNPAGLARTQPLKF
jgi:alpha-tubulin suppressor-like RCC1 family protein